LNYNGLEKVYYSQAPWAELQSLLFSFNNENKTSAFQMLAVSLRGSFCQKIAILYQGSKILQEAIDDCHCAKACPLHSSPGHWLKENCPSLLHPAQRYTHSKTKKTIPLCLLPDSKEPSLISSVLGGRRELKDPLFLPQYPGSSLRNRPSH
jgi:hypothetical protein